MAKHNQNPPDNELITMSFRVYGIHAKMIHQAAALQHQSTLSYMRKIVTEWAAADLGLEAPDYNALTLGPQKIAEAAKARGQTVREFTAQAAREAAMRVLSESRREPERVPVHSEIRDLAPPRTASGTRRRAG